MWFGPHIRNIYSNSLNAELWNNAEFDHIHALLDCSASWVSLCVQFVSGFGTFHGNLSLQTPYDYPSKLVCVVINRVFFGVQPLNLAIAHCGKKLWRIYFQYLIMISFIISIKKNFTFTLIGTKNSVIILKTILILILMAKLWYKCKF